MIGIYEFEMKHKLPKWREEAAVHAQKFGDPFSHLIGRGISVRTKAKRWFPLAVDGSLVKRFVSLVLPFFFAGGHRAG